MTPILYAQHYIGASIDAALSWDMDDIELTQTMVGGASRVEGLYLYQKEHFIFQIGMGIRFVGIGQRVDSVDVIRDLRCMAYYPEFVIPIMFGATYGSVYTMLGMNTSGVFGGLTRQDGKYMYTSLDSDKYFPDYNEAMKQIKISNTSIMWNYYDIDLVLEAGTILPMSPIKIQKNKPIIRIGAFVEYGLLNGMPKKAKDLISQTGNVNLSDLHVEHIHAIYTSETASKNNWCIGARLTFLFNIANLSNSQCRCVDY